MKYRGYTGHVEYDDEAEIFHGEILGIKDVITFQGRSVEEIEQPFRDSIDDYLAFCEQRGEENLWGRGTRKICCLKSHKKIN